MGLAKELRSRRVIETKMVEVDAWGDENGAFCLYCRPLTCYDISVLQKKHKDFMTNTTITAMVDLIVMKALDEDGNKLFTSAEDRADLMGEQTDVIADIANEMFNDIESEEKALKN